MAEPRSITVEVTKRIRIVMDLTAEEADELCRALSSLSEGDIPYVLHRKAR